MNTLEKASSNYLLILMQENEKEIENLTLQNIGLQDELSRRSLK